MSLSPVDQLPLDLPTTAQAARADLVVASSNSHAAACVDAWPDWAAPVAVLAGPTGSGKSHLASIWSSMSHAVVLSPGDAVLAGRAMLLEDVTAGGFSDEWLFHAMNAAMQPGGSLLITSRQWPGEWGVSLPDLQSRLRLVHLVELHEPNDELLRGVLFKLFADRQLIVDAAVIDYCITRMERSLASALAVVRQLDVLSLARKQAITKPLVAEALRMTEEGAIA
ncbi:ATP/GTP-binding protein [Ahrensia sp. R2A130]|uniref:HdaA/DnaA family protein n=1 Tax=Ahrensia sp. R2A130 TaxID=744979 RepID=UPI0001E09417|nr:ATP/GTP-binding protein [Ahrensia sp. R2A130]EFL90568.1 ATP/GTP-binding protein [Ahrensia sp. R2A130]